MKPMHVNASWERLKLLLASLVSVSLLEARTYQPFVPEIWNVQCCREARNVTKNHTQQIVRQQSQALICQLSKTPIVGIVLDEC